MQPSPQQAHIYTLRSSFQVDAVAGSGKTTTLVEVAKRLPIGKTLALAFNKKIQEEMAQRLPSHITCKTMNALGYGIIAQHIQSRPQHYNWKDYDLLAEICKAAGLEWKKRDEEFKQVLDLVNQAKNLLIIPKAKEAVAKSSLKDTQETWERMSLDIGYDCTSQQILLAQKLLQLSVDAAFKGSTNFADQIYLPAAFPLKIGEKLKFDILLVDEAQDLSEANHIMLKKVSNPGARLISFGDPYQSIYAFRGANPNSMAQLAEDWNLEPAPLSVSFRCPQEVVREAQMIVPHIQPSAEAISGQVNRWTEWTIDMIPPRSHILCRNNRPLAELTTHLKEHGVSFEYLGNDFYSQAQRHIKALGRSKTPKADFLKALEEWYKKRPSHRSDMYGTLKSLAQGAKTVKDILANLEETFGPKNRDPNTITLSTIHKSKGLEWKNVFFLNSYLIPSTFATTENELQQEQNLRYVAITRAQENLIYINLEDLEVSL